MHQTKKDNPSAKAFQAARVKLQSPFEKRALEAPNESSQSPVNFSFLWVMSKKETGKRSVLPLSFPLKRSGSATNRSVSPSPFENNQRMQRQSPSEHRRFMSVHRMGEMKREGQIVESYIKRSKHLFKALLNAHWSRKENHKLQTIRR